MDWGWIDVLTAKLSYGHGDPWEFYAPPASHKLSCVMDLPSKPALICLAETCKGLGLPVIGPFEPHNVTPLLWRLLDLWEQWFCWAVSCLPAVAPRKRPVLPLIADRASLSHVQGFSLSPCSVLWIVQGDRKSFHSGKKNEAKTSKDLSHLSYCPEFSRVVLIDQGQTLFLCGSDPAHRQMPLRAILNEM